MRRRIVPKATPTPLVEKDPVATASPPRNWNTKYLLLPLLAFALYYRLASSTLSHEGTLPNEHSSYVICSPNSTTAIHTIAKRNREEVAECVAVRDGAVSYVGALADITRVFELVGIQNFDLRFLKPGEIMLPGLYVFLH